MSRWPFRRSLRPGQVRADPDAEIREEIDLYLELRARELEQEEGMTPEEARRAAETRFGDANGIARSLRRRAKRRHAREEMAMSMSGLRQDLFYALRTLRRSPAFALVAIATLGLTLGGNTAIFSVVDAALLEALPFRDHEELVFVNGYHLDDGEVAIRLASYPEFRDWRERANSFTRMASIDASSVALTGDGQAERLMAELVSDGYFDILGGSAERGRTFLPDEHLRPDAAPVAVISYGLWERRFALDPSAVGSEIIVDDRPLTVVGVMPERFRGINLVPPTDIWIPDMMLSLVMDTEVLDARGSRFLSVIGRLAPGATIEQAQLELDAIARDLQERYPRAHEDRYAQVRSFRDGYLGDIAGLLWILMGAGLVLLLIAAANVANLLLVRAHGRTRELVLRRALGARGSRVGRQMLTESLVLAGLGGAAGLGVAVVALRILGPMIPNGALPGYVEPELSPAAFAFTLGVLAMVGVVTGLAPALSSARLDIASRLREGSAASSFSRGPSPQHLFVVAQVALALVLTVGAGLLTRSFTAQLAVETGSRLEGVHAMRVQLPNARYDSDETVRSFAREVERRMAEIPGVASVSISSDLPFRGGSSGSYIFREGDGAEERIRFHRHHVTPGYFETLDVELRDGRLFSAADDAAAPPVIVVTEAMARRVFPGESAVGKRMSLSPDDAFPVEVIGVIEDVRYRDVTTSLMEEANSPDVFLSFWQFPTRSVEVGLRGRDGWATPALDMRRALAEVDPQLPAFQLQPLIDGWRGETATPRFAAFLMSVFSALALILACIGIYGVLAFSVGQRSREIAIRRAVGASAGRVARSVIGDGLKLASVGLVAGGAAATAASGILERFLYGVRATDPLTFLSVGGGVVAVALLAAVIPALRAIRRDPAETLNAE